MQVTSRDDHSYLAKEVTSPLMNASKSDGKARCQTRREFGVDFESNLVEVLTVEVDSCQSWMR
jgi:hypothetical protein